MTRSGPIAASVSEPVEVRHKRPPLRALTSLRFFAAIHVVLFHESHWAGHLPFFPAAARVVNSGYTAVTLFFVLSGFILAYNYERVPNRTEFWVSRFARIYPVYLLSLLPPLLITPHWSYHPRPGLLGVLLTFTLLQGWVPSLAFSLNMAAWTLSVEAFFYALFPFLLPWIERIRTRAFVAVQFCWLLIVCAPPVLALHPGTAATAHQLADLLESSLPIVRVNAFVLGMFAGVRFRNSLRKGRTNQRETHGRRAGALALLSVAIIVLLWLQPSPIYLPLRTEALQLSYMCFIWILAQVEWRVLTNHIMQMAGEISYSIYVLQFPVLFAYDDAYHRLFPTRVHLSALYIAVLCGVAYVSFRWIEMPARLLIRRLASGRPVPVRAI